MADTARLCFISEWLDPNSGVIWKYQLFYYPNTKEVEMVDIKNRRTFLKKTRYEDLRPELLFMGSTVVVFSRQLKIIDYGDEYTRRQLESSSERTLAMVKPDAFKNLGKIMNAISQSGFIISKLRVAKLSLAEAEEFYSWEDCCHGACGAFCHQEKAPNSLRAAFGTDGSYNAVHGSDAPDTAAQEVAFHFGPGRLLPGKCSLGRATSLLLIKPHLVADGAAGLVIDLLMDVFDVTALQQFTLDSASAVEFYEVYKGVLAAGELNAMVEELTSGPCIAIEVADRDGAECVESLRQLAGPMDPELARVLRPQSLRARFGLNKTRNGVHVTDLAEDGLLETSYFFTILQ
ncbi:MAG: hypothetical protein WDW38_010990 [Sanguina aurantia]